MCYKYILLTKMARKGKNKCNISVAAQIGFVRDSQKRMQTVRFFVYIFYYKELLTFHNKMPHIYMQFQCSYTYLRNRSRSIYITYAFVCAYTCIFVISAGKMFLIKTKIVFMYTGNHRYETRYQKTLLMSQAKKKYG